MIDQLVAIAAGYGLPGMGLLYFAWRDHQRDKREEDRGKRLEAILTANAESDKDLAVAMTILAERVR